jgi:hypothetical protein
MSGNAEDRPGSSKQFSDSEKDPDWEANDAATTDEEEEVRGADAATGEEEEVRETDYLGEGEETTDGGAGRTDGGSGGDPPAQKKKRVARGPRKDRKAQVLANVTDAITKVSDSGLPLEPAKVAKGYSMQLGCIVRESMSINTKDIRSEANKVLAETLLKKLHQRYTFPAPFNKKVDSLALTKMSTALSSWRSRVKKKIADGESWEKISSKEPTLEKEDFDVLKAYVNTEECEAWTEWGRQMRDLNIGAHHLGSGGYRGKQPVWDKEDRELQRLGKDNPWLKITDEQIRNFVRSRYKLDWATGEFVTEDEAVKAFEKCLVRIYISSLYNCVDLIR